MSVDIRQGDCLEVMADMADNSIDAIVTDPPYGLGFMGKEWDALPPGEEWARECLRVLKPGGHLLAFGGSRTWHRLAVAVEDAGFEIRDSIAWLYGSGFPKSLDVSKAIDATVLHGGSNSRRLREAELAGDGAAYTMTGKNNGIMGETVTVERKTFEAVTDEAKAWEGWGTALKPAFEPVVVARKPLAGTVAANVLEYGTGALNIDGCRVGDEERAGTPVGLGSMRLDGCSSIGELRDLAARGAKTPNGRDARTTLARAEAATAAAEPKTYTGRWPANVVLDESQAAELDRQSGVSVSRASAGRNGRDEASATWGLRRTADEVRGHNDSGGASRFFYVAKAPKKERPTYEADDGRKVAHPTVKPLALIRWLVRLVTPPDGVVLDPFAGSGTTVEAAILEGVDVVAIEREADYLPLIEARVRRALDTPRQGTLDWGQQTSSPTD